MQNELLKTLCIILNYCLFTMRNNYELSAFLSFYTVLTGSLSTWNNYIFNKVYIVNDLTVLRHITGCNQNVPLKCQKEVNHVTRLAQLNVFARLCSRF